MAEKEELVDLLPKDSWVRDWMECWPYSEMPRSYLLFAAFAMIGAVYGRKAWLPQDWRLLYPMLNVLLIGPSGVGKTSALEAGFEYLIQRVPKGERPSVIAGKPSPEKLHWDLRGDPHTIIYAEELASFITKQKYMEGMIPYLTELLNYKEAVEQRSKVADVVVVVKPEVVVMGGSTIKWLQEQLPDSATAGGFLPRFLIVYEKYKWQHVPLPDLAISKSEKMRLGKLRERVGDDFVGLVNCIRGPLKFWDYSVADAYILWDATHSAASGHLEPFAERAEAYILRLAMLSALSCGRDKILEVDMHAAIKLYEYCEKSLQEVVVPFTVQGQLLNLVMDAVGNKTVTQVMIRRAMRNYISSQEVDKLVDSLLASNDLIRIDDHRLTRRG